VTTFSQIKTAIGNCIQFLFSIWFWGEERKSARVIRNAFFLTTPRAFRITMKSREDLARNPPHWKLNKIRSSFAIQVFPCIASFICYSILQNMTIVSLKCLLVKKKTIHDSCLTDLEDLIVSTDRQEQLSRNWEISSWNTRQSRSFRVADPGFLKGVVDLIFFFHWKKVNKIANSRLPWRFLEKKLVIEHCCISRPWDKTKMAESESQK